MKKYLVFDIGGSAIKYALMNEKAGPLEKGQVPTPKENIESFVEAIGGVFDQYKEGIEGIAVSMPGRIDSDRGYAYTGGALRYNYDKDIVSILSARCPVPITIENDGKRAALAEAWIGSLSDCNDGIVVVLGTGIGGGIIKDKKLHKGRHFIAGEFSAIITKEITEENMPSMFWSDEGGYMGLITPVAKAKNIPVEKMDGHKVFNMIHQGDEEVIEIFESYCAKLVIQLFNLYYILDPEKIAIGGGISEQNILIETIQKYVEKHANSLPFDLGRPEVVRCKFRNDSNLIGALYRFMTKVK